MTDMPSDVKRLPANDSSTKSLHMEKSERTRTELLDAGARIMVAGPATGAFAHLTAQRVASEAGRTTGAFFHQWASMDAYLRELFEHILDPARATTLAAVIDSTAAGADRGGDALTLILESCRHALEVAGDDPQTIAEVLMWARALRDPTVPVDLIGMYDRLDGVGGRYFDEIIGHLGRELRPPFTSAVFSAVTAAVSQGLSVRTELTPGFYPDDILGMVFVALLPLFTRDVGDEDDATGWMRSVLGGTTPPQ
jgi:AcrR family transcriptional regulator